MSTVERKKSAVCCFDGCDKEAVTKGLCVGHYGQHRKGQELRPLAPRSSNKGKVCYGPECGKSASAMGLCQGHHKQLKRYNELYPLGTRRPSRKTMYEGVECAFDGCDRSAAVKGLCSTHRQQVRIYGSMWAIGSRSSRKPTTPCQHHACEEVGTKRGYCDFHYRQVLTVGASRDRQRTITRTGRRLASGGYVMIKLPGHPETGRTGWGLEHRVVMSDHIGRPLWPDETVHHKNGVRTDNRVENLELWSSHHPNGQRVVDKLAWAREIIERYGSDPNIT